MPTPLLFTVYCVLIVLASVGGGLIPLLVRLTHTRLQIAISLTAGFMLGVALLHMIPHALFDAPASVVMLWVLAGFLFMFFLERFFSFHSHEAPASSLHAEPHAPPEPHHHGHPHPPPNARLSWTGAAIGLTLHSLIAGIALAAAVLADTASDSHHPRFAGLAVFLVIFLHKPLDALTVITLTASAGLARPKRHLINALFALAVPLGVVLVLLRLAPAHASHAHDASAAWVAGALAFSAGTFLCVALSDLLPELHFHTHDRGKLSVALLLGVAFAVAVAQAEHSLHDHPGHGHQTDHADHLDIPAPGPDQSTSPAAPHPHPHDHHDHDH
ncbi:MAG: ZIP family metal transporter [Planctomycetota bacterium]